MINPINHTINIDKRDAFGSFLTPITTKRHFDISTYRNHQKEPVSKEAKIAIGLGSVLGTLIPIILLAKHQKSSVFNVKYGLKEMIMTSCGSIAGGVATGLLVDKKENRKQKIHEGVFQFMNASVPPLVVAPIITLCDKFKSLNNLPSKVIGTLGGLGLGMVLAAKLSNLINDPKDLVPDRKLTVKDSIANIDDALGVFVLAKLPFADKLHADKILPVIYGWCGYRAGKSN